MGDNVDNYSLIKVWWFITMAVQSYFYFCLALTQRLRTADETLILKIWVYFYQKENLFVPTHEKLASR